MIEPCRVFPETLLCMYTQLHSEAYIYTAGYFIPGVLGGKSGAWVVFRCYSVFAEETYTLVSLLQAVCTTRIVSRVREYLFECPEETGGVCGKLKIERRART